MPMAALPGCPAMNPESSASSCDLTVNPSPLSTHVRCYVVFVVISMAMRIRKDYFDNDAVEEVGYEANLYTR